MRQPLKGAPGILAMALSGSGAIEAMEAAGQRELVASTLLPTKCRRNRDVLEAAGVVFGELVEDDPIFCNATLPAGWEKKGTGHSMWSDLVDGDGRVRAMIFYKAAFYDRSAHINVRARITIDTAYAKDEDGRDDYDNPVRAEVRDGDQVLHAVEVNDPPGTPSYYRGRDATTEATAWADANLPGWRIDDGGLWDKPLPTSR